MPLFSRKKKRKTNMSDSQRTEEERTHTKILKTEREYYSFVMKFPPL